MTKEGLQYRNIHILDGTKVENKGKLILTEIFPSVQKHIESNDIQNLDNCNSTSKYIS